MQKQLFLVMLGLSVIGGTADYVSPAFAAVAPAPNVKVKGQVVDASGEPLVGVTVIAKGTSNGTVTDLDGYFELNVASDAVLQISYVGFESQEVPVKGRASLPVITLAQDNKLLEQVVVVGYGVQKKADLTGSVSIVNADELKRSSNSNISTMLEGKVPGVQITSDGQPGADPTVRIRGIGSFGSTDPLYVVDGVPMGNSIRDFSPNDIETIQVLKDAAAGAIYGSRAANGVVIITTKNGKQDQPLKVDYKGYFGIDQISSGVYDVMNADQYSQYLGEACKNSGIALPGGYSADGNGKYRFMDNTNTDWFKEVFKTGIRQNHNVNLSGGGKTNTYNIALDYFNQKGTLEGAGPNYERYTARINNTFETKFIKFRTGVVYSHSNQDGMGLSNASEYVQGLYGDVTNVLRGTLLMQPTIKAYDESTWVLDDKVGAANAYNYDAYGYGVYYDTVHGDISASNPLLINNKLTRNTKVDRINATVSATVDLFKMVGWENKNHKLSYNINLSYNKTFTTGKTFIGAWIQSNRVYLAKSNETLSQYKNTYTDGLIENTLTYEGTIADKFHINLVAGQTYEENNRHDLNAWGKNLSEPYFLQLQHAADRDASSYEYKHAMASYFGRLNFDYDGKYLISAIVRRDGSSRLTKNIRWETFPSVSLGWRIDKEKFFEGARRYINMFKLRGSYGVLGNENPVADYAYQATINRGNMSYSFGNNPVYGSTPEYYVNTQIAWEKKETTNVGIDMAFLDNKIEFTAEWYKNVSKDLLYNVPVPSSTGVRNESVTKNAGTMENSGLEFSVTYRDRTSFGLSYDISANVSTLKNKVTKLDGEKTYRNDGDYITIVGEEIGQFYGYEFLGIARTQADIDNHVNADGKPLQENAAIGDCLYADLNNDGKIDANDRKVLGSGLPKVNFGLSAHLAWKGIDLSVSTYGALDYHVSDDIYNSLNSSYGYGNKDVALLNANKFDSNGKYISDVPRTQVQPTGEHWNNYFSDRKIQNAAYWKIANIELGYNFPDKWFHDVISGVRIYASAQNVATFTSYKGYNVDYAGGTFTPGYNFCSFPTPRTYMFGLLLSF